MCTLPDICEDHPKAAEDQRQFSAVSVREGASENTEDDGANVLDPEDVGDQRGGLKVDLVLLLLTELVAGEVPNFLTDDIQEQILPGEINHPIFTKNETNIRFLDLGQNI